MKYRTPALLAIVAAIGLAGCEREYPVPQAPGTLPLLSHGDDHSVPWADAGPLQYYNKFAVEHERLIYFDSAEHELGHLEEEKLDEFIEVIRSFDDYVVEVVGHTDEIGENTDNKSLSEERVRSVVDYLMSKSVTPARIASKAASENHPAARGDSSYRHQLNRRVHVMLRPAKP